MFGNDGGLDVSYDGGDTWDFITTMAVGQFYAISADMRKPYYVCGGLQDNGSWCGPSAKRSNVGILNSDWFRVGGGDGFYTQQDPTDWAIVYSESQDGAVSRLDLRAGTSTSIRPRGARGGAQGQNAAAQALGGPEPAVRGGRRPRTSCRSLRPARRSGSSGTRRPCSRRTTRAPCSSAATGCSSR